MQKILKDSTQTLIDYPRLDVGGDIVIGQSSATDVDVRFHTPAWSPATVDTWQAGSVDNFEAVVASAASEGATAIALTTSAGYPISGRNYIISTGNAQTIVDTIVVECSVTDQGGTYLNMKTGLVRNVQADESIVGWAVTKALSTAQTATCGECIAIWRVIIGGVTYQWSQPFQIVRRMPVWSLTPAALSADYPIILSSRDGEDVNLERLIKAALRHEILPLLHARGIAEENIVSTEELEPLHALACVISVLRQRPDTDETYFQRMQARYDQLKESVFASSRWYELNQQIDPPILQTEQQANQQGNGIRISR